MRRFGKIWKKVQAWFESIYEIPLCMLYTAVVIPVGNLKYSVCSLRLEFYLQYFWHNSINMEYLNALQTPTVQLTSNLKSLKYIIDFIRFYMILNQFRGGPVWPNLIIISRPQTSTYRGH